MNDGSIQRLIQLIELLLQLMGSVPDSLPPDPNEAIQLLAAQYRLLGLPDNMTDWERIAAVGLVLEAFAVLETTAPLLEPESVSLMKTVLNAMYSELTATRTPAQ